MMSISISSQQLKAEAQRLGFSACGMAMADKVDNVTTESFKAWLAEGCQADMSYLCRYEEQRFDPRLLIDHPQTIISVALNYSPKIELPTEEYQLAWYAYGKDYHEVMKEKLNQLLDFLKTNYNINGRAFCDTAPILERYWAWRAGLGWIGKHTQLIIPKAGSCFFLGELIVDLPADRYDEPQKAHCGNCTRCLEACPTKALEKPFKLNANKCLSYLTIEHRGEFNPEVADVIGKHIYGCDECLKACPWSRFKMPTTVCEFAPSDALLQMKKNDWHTLSLESYQKLFKGSAVKRAKYEGLMRNINTARSSDEEKIKST